MRMKKSLAVVGVLAFMLLICQVVSVNAESHKPDLTITVKSEKWVDLTNKTYNIAYTIKNAGNATANASITRIHIDNVSVNDTVEALAPGKTYRNTLGPFTLSGNNDTIRICGDANNTIDESNEENNCRENVLKASSDLIIVEKSEHWIDLTNKTYNITYTTMNWGTETANASLTRIHIDNISINDSVEALAPGETYTSILGPFAISDDNDTIRICVDANNTIVETNEGNNCMKNVLKAGPDLVIVEQSEDWVDLTNKTYNVTYTVMNWGTETANASVTRIHIDTIPVNDSAGALAPGETYTSMLGPFAITDGNDTIRICVDVNTAVEESNEGNNCVENVFKTYPDLVIVEKSENWVDFDNMRYNVTYTIMNKGTDTANVSVTCIYIDSILVITDTVEALAPSETYTRMFGPFAISGDYDIITICVDVNNTVEESSEENNCVENVFKIGPDLIMEEKREEWIDLINMRYNVTYTVKNVGAETANASMINICIDNASVVNDSIRALAPGENYTNAVGPFTMTGKSDGIKICADSTDFVSESREGNNCVQNVLEYPGIPDLIITGLPEEGIARANRTYNTMPYMVRNVGDGVAGPSEVSIKINGIEKMTELVGALAPGENYTSAAGHFSTTRSNDAITICADRENVVSERNEENNCIERIVEEKSEEAHGPAEAPKIPGFELAFALVGLLALAAAFRFVNGLRKEGKRVKK